MPRSAKRHLPVKRDDEGKPVRGIIRPASDHARYGYRRIAAVLQAKGRTADHRRVGRIWREQGLKAPEGQPGRRRLRLGDGSCARLRAECKDHVRGCDPVEGRLPNGRKARFLNVVGECGRTLAACAPRRSWRDSSVAEALHEASMAYGAPDYLRSDNGSGFAANKVGNRLSSAGVATPYTEPGSPWENGYRESFDSKMRDEFLNREAFETFHEAEALAEEWMRYHDYERPRGSLGYKPPAIQTVAA